MSVATLDLAPRYRTSGMLRGGWQLASSHGPVDHAQAMGRFEEPSPAVRDIIRFCWHREGSCDESSAGFFRPGRALWGAEFVRRPAGAPIHRSRFRDLPRCPRPCAVPLGRLQGRTPADGPGEDVQGPRVAGALRSVRRAGGIPDHRSSGDDRSDFRRDRSQEAAQGDRLSFMRLSGLGLATGSRPGRRSGGWPFRRLRLGKPW